MTRAEADYLPATDAWTPQEASEAAFTPGCSRGEQPSSGLDGTEAVPQDVRRKNVLVVAYHFPPAGDVGVHRTLRFVKCLPRLGWNPIVLTTSNGKFQKLDPTMASKVPSGLRVYRTPSFELLNYGNRLDGSGPRPLPKIISRLFRELPRDLWKWLAMPDGRIGWVPGAIRQAERIVKECDIDAVYVTGKPFSSYFIGKAISRKFNIPWIMDLRDLWTLNQRNRPRSPLHKFVEHRMERRLVRHASAVVVNTPDNRRDFIRGFPQCDPDKFVAITNGFDRDDFRGLEVEKYEKFTIGYSGTFYFPHSKSNNRYRRLMGLQQRRAELFDAYSPRCLFEALHRMFSRQPEMRDRVEIVMTGAGCRKTEALLEEYDLARNIKLLGWLEYEESLAVLKRCHALLLVLSRGVESKGWIPSKLFQYLGAGTPILGLLPDGDAQEIVTKTGAGVVHSPDDIVAVERTLRQWYDAYLVGRTEVTPQREKVAQYEARALTQRLAGCLDAVTGIDPRCRRLRSRTE